MSLFKRWLHDPRRPTYDGIICDAEAPRFGPNKKQHFVNTWTGFGVAENENASWDRMLEHIQENVANEKDDCAKYILDWLAYLVQHPTEACGVSLDFFSEQQGVGKGFVTRAGQGMIGPVHSFYITDPAHLTGRFNFHLQRTILLVLDECLFPGNKEQQSKLKSLLTEPDLPVEEKFGATTNVNNMLSVMTSSNNEWIASLPNTDRRHAMFEVGSKKMQNRKYFGRLHCELYEQGGLGRMLFDLRRRELGDWHPESNIPATALRLENQRESAEPIEKWLADLLAEGALPRAREDRYNNVSLAPNEVQGSVLFDAARKRRGLERATDVKIAKYLEDKCGVKGEHRRFGNVRVFPELAKARERFLKTHPYWEQLGNPDQEWAGDDDHEGYDFG
jgi:hypothetical protein